MKNSLIKRNPTRIEILVISFCLAIGNLAIADKLEPDKVVIYNINLRDDNDAAVYAQRVENIAEKMLAMMQANKLFHSRTHT